MPFAGYSDFADCVSDNQDVDNPEAFCAWLEHETTGAWPAEKELSMLDALKTKNDLLLAEALLKNPKLSMKDIEAIIEDFDNWEKDLDSFVVELSCKENIINVQALGKWLGNVKDETPVAKSQPPAWKHKCSIVGPIVTKQEELRIVTAPVLVPGEQDSDGEVVTKEQVEKVALEFMEQYQIIDIGHSFNKVAVPVESWLTRKQERIGETDIPEGTWMMSVKIQDDSTWAGIKAGTYKGFSITAVRRSELAEAVKANKSAADGKTLLADLGDDWVVATVAIVEDPSVIKAKWIAIKSGLKRGGLSAWFKSRFGIDNDSKKSNKNETEEIEMDETKLTELMGTAIKQSAEEIMAAIAALATRIDALEAAAPKDKVTEPAPDADKSKDKVAKGADLGVEIAKSQSELLALYDTPADMVENKKDHGTKIDALKTRIAIIQDIMGTDKDDADKDEPEPDALKAKKSATKSRGISSQDGIEASQVLDGAIKRDFRGCVIKQ